MNKLRLVASGIFIVILFSCNSVKKYNEAIQEKHSVKELHKDIDFAFRKIKRLHPNLYWFISEEQLNHKIDSVKKSISQPMTSKEFFYVLSPLVSEIRQGHNNVGYPYTRMEKDSVKKYRNSKTYLSKLHFESVEGKIIISEVYDTIKTLENAEVLKIGKFKVEELIKKHNRLRSSDGFNETFFERRAGLFLKSYYSRENQTMDTVTLQLKIRDSIFDTTFYRVFDVSKKEKEEAKLKSKEKEETKKELSKEELKKKKEEEEKKREYESIRGYNKETKLYKKDYKFLGEDSTVGYLKVRSFSGAYVKLYNEFFNKLDTLNSSTVILDLRDNLGGSLNEIHNLLGYFSEENYITIEKMQTNTRTPKTNVLWSTGNNKPLYILFKALVTPFLFTYEELTARKKNGLIYTKSRASRMTEPKLNSFKGKVYVLVNGNSFSASSIISANLQGMQRATIVGEETGGTFNGTVAGIFKPLTLPNSKLPVFFGFGMIKSSFIDSPDGYGVIPEYKVTPTIKDRKNGVDTELNFILELVKKEKKVKK